MRILTLNHEFPPLGGGASPFSYECARQLVQAGHEVDVITMGYRGLPWRERLDGCCVYRVPCLRAQREICRTHEMASYLASALPMALSLIVARRYDVNHTHFILPAGSLALALKRLTGLPYVITAHGSDVRGYNRDRFTKEHRWARSHWHRIVNGAATVTSPSTFLADLISRSGTDARVRTVPYGFNVERFKPAPKEKKILVVTRMLRRKGVQYLLEALRDIDLAGFEVVLVGDGPYLPELRNMARAYALDVSFRGWLANGSAELRELYERSSIFVLTSEAENFPVVLLEAMSAGMAIITARETGCPEVVGDAGLLVPSRDADTLRQALRRLIADPALQQHLGASARARVEERFSWSRIADTYVATLKAACRPGGRP